MANPTSITVAGAVQWYMGTGGTLLAPTYEFLGWSEGDTQISINGEFEDIVADYAGSRVPADVSFMAEDAQAEATIVRTNIAVMNRALTRIRGGTLGAYANGTVGSLMEAEGLAPGLALVFPYATKVPFANVGAIYGMYFPTAWVNQGYDNSVSTKKTTWRVRVRAIPFWNAVANTGILFYTTQGDFPSLPGPS